jgi:hypothetical protein
MSDDAPLIPPRPGNDAATDPLVALLGDLHQLSEYLHQRSRQTYETASRFAEHARQSADTRGYDERQATMLEYQHHIWNEIAGLLDRVIMRYAEPEDDTPGE